MVVDCCCGSWRSGRGLFGRLSACFRDYREPQRTRHAVEVLVAARVLGLALGYEDLNDHDTLRQSKLLVAAVRGGRPGRAQGKLAGAAAGKSTLNRMELTGPALEAGERYKKIVADTRLLRLHAAGVAAALGLGRHPAGAGAMRHDPPQVAQDRRADPGQRTSRTPVVR